MYSMYIMYTVYMKEVLKVKTVQIGKRLIIMNGVDPLRYLDLTTNKVHKYDNRTWLQKLLRKKQNPLRIVVRAK